MFSLRNTESNFDLHPLIWKAANSHPKHLTRSFDYLMKCVNVVLTD